MWPKTPSGCFFAFLFVVAVIAVLGSVFGGLADFLINPQVDVPDNIPIPGGK